MISEISSMLIEESFVNVLVQESPEVVRAELGDILSKAYEEESGAFLKGVPEYMKKLGQLLSAIVYRNIAVIITVGIIQGVFGVYGWWYNDRILLLVNPINNILLPILLGYTGGEINRGTTGSCCRIRRDIWINTISLYSCHPWCIDYRAVYRLDCKKAR